MMAKRGMMIEAVHFHSYPYTSQRAQEKVEDLAKIIATYCGRFRDACHQSPADSRGNRYKLPGRGNHDTREKIRECAASEKIAVDTGCRDAHYG